MVGKLKRDAEKKNDSFKRKDEKTPNHLFSQFLAQEIDEQRASSVNCRNVTYGQDSRLHTFEYQTREYRY